MAYEYTSLSQVVDAQEQATAPQQVEMSFESLANEKAARLADKKESLTGSRNVVRPDWVEDNPNDFLHGKKYKDANGKWHTEYGTSSRDGYDEWGGNKNYNDLTMDQLGGLLGRSYADMGISAELDANGRRTGKFTDNATGKVLQGSFNRQTGEWDNPEGYSNLYMFGTKGDPNEVKLGTHKGGSSEHRYDGSDPNYGNKPGSLPGPTGVDVSNKQMELIMPTNVVNHLERLYHGNKKVMEQRLLRNQTGTQDDMVYRDATRQFGSGATEAYKNVDALFPHSNAQTADDKLYGEFLGLAGYQVGQNPNSGWGSMTKEEIAKWTAEREADDMGVMGRLGNAVKALGKSFVQNLALDTADWVGETLKRQTGYGWDVGTEKEKADMVSNLFGYNQVLAERATEKAKQHVKNLYEAATEDDKKFDSADVYGLIKETMTTPEMLGESIGYVLSMIPGWGIKAGQAVAKGTQAIENGTKALKAAEMAGNTTKAAEIAQGIKTAQTLVQANKQQAAIGKVVRAVGLTNVAVGDVNDQIDYYKENNDGKPPSAGHIMTQMVPLAVAATALDKMSFSYITGAFGGKESAKGLISEAKELVETLPKAGKLALAGKVATATGEILKAGGVEAATEYLQTTAELFNKQFDTSKYGDDPIKILTSKDNIIEALTGSAFGAGMGAQMKAVSPTMAGLGAVADSAKDGLGKAAETIGGMYDETKQAAKALKESYSELEQARVADTESEVVAGKAPEPELQSIEDIKKSLTDEKREDVQSKLAAALAALGKPTTTKDEVVELGKATQFGSTMEEMAEFEAELDKVVEAQTKQGTVSQEFLDKVSALKRGVEEAKRIEQASTEYLIGDTGIVGMVQNVAAAYRSGDDGRIAKAKQVEDHVKTLVDRKVARQSEALNTVNDMLGKMEFGLRSVLGDTATITDEHRAALMMGARNGKYETSIVSNGSMTPARLSSIRAKIDTDEGLKTAYELGKAQFSKPVRALASKEFGTGKSTNVQVAYSTVMENQLSKGATKQNGAGFYQVMNKIEDEVEVGRYQLSLLQKAQDVGRNGGKADTSKVPAEAVTPVDSAASSGAVVTGSVPPSDTVTTPVDTGTVPYGGSVNSSSTQTVTAQNYNNSPVLSSNAASSTLGPTMSTKPENSVEGFTNNVSSQSDPVATSQVTQEQVPTTSQDSVDTDWESLASTVDNSAAVEVEPVEVKNESEPYVDPGWASLEAMADDVADTVQVDENGDVVVEREFSPEFEYNGRVDNRKKYEPVVTDKTDVLVARDKVQELKKARKKAERAAQKAESVRFSALSRATGGAIEALAVKDVKSFVDNRLTEELRKLTATDRRSMDTAKVINAAIREIRDCK